MSTNVPNVSGVEFETEQDDQLDGVASDAPEQTLSETPSGSHGVSAPAVGDGEPAAVPGS